MNPRQSRKSRPPMRDHADDTQWLQEGRRVLEEEADALMVVRRTLDARFCRAVKAVAACRGKVVTTGVGKSGFIAQKLASTLASLGRSAFYVHPTEGVHGDLGMLQSGDLLIAISHSGNTSELMSFLLVAKKYHRVPIIAIVGGTGGGLGRLADLILTTGVEEEACVLGLAPTTSSTAALALGDALAVTVSRLMKLQAKDFAALHPAGSLGGRLYAPVAQLMRHEFPRARADQSLKEIAPLISAGGLGLIVVQDGKRSRFGIITDGDIRRAAQAGSARLEKKAGDVMSSPPKTIDVKSLGVDALMRMENSKITSLVVTDGHRRPVGVLHIHDILRYGLGLDDRRAK
ncbi:MAG: KpsF/GutQ family sugar-phosphate isomerase [Elusimicrobia bacterium]|nr:KpsF/GutQ family sugar-phosphate isomerase [Elusimicrobiota bacterium]